MVKRTGNNKIANVSGSEEMPAWACKLIERFDSYSSCIQHSLTNTFDRVFAKLSELQESQYAIVSRLSELEKNILSNSTAHSQQNVLYSTLVKVRADSQRIDEKLRMITWVGIDEQVNEDATRRFDREILKEVVYTSGDNDLIREFDEGKISSYRYPSGKPRGPGVRGRIIKISLSSQALRDSLLAHMRSGRQSLTKQFVHSFARRDYTPEELDLDRTLRKEAGDRNAREGKLAYVVRDFDIVKLRTPRDLPRRSLPNVNPTKSSASSTASRTTRSQATLPRSSLPSHPSRSSFSYTFNDSVNCPNSQPSLSSPSPLY
ncbi:hypothetical protein Y032_0189g1208 [Ancylostoma ceylanicum]|uniref:Uncharacterized protein n=1 Tax=Ancylostoma ceylanicum TaxID=53326 RepID=A0A016SQ94_9BILA|nr:hypothetical protein Y032_0189g1208 [Ancylostoma ceylanicum]